jgi:hypothetical protein
LRSGRKARCENKIVDVGLGLRCDFRFRSKTGLNRLGLDARRVEAAPVVGDLDDDMAALPRSAQPDRASTRLAGGASLGRALDAVVGAIANQVRQRIFDQLEDLTIELRLGSVRFNADVFTELGRKVTNDPRQPLPCIADRLHPRLHHLVLDLRRDRR